MRFLIHWILAFFIFLNPTIVLPALTDYDRQEFAFKNALADKNPGFESGSAGWTCSPALAINTTAGDQIVPRSKGFATWDSTSAAQNCYSTAVKIPQSGNCAVGIWYKIPSGTGTHLIVANDGTNDLATESIVSSTLSRYQEVEFPCASSTTGNARIGIRSVASNEPSISFDDFYAGRATQVRDVNINTEWASYTPAVSAISGTLTNFTVQGSWRQNGDSADYKIRLVFTGAVGTWSNPLFGLPTGHVIDESKIPGGSISNYSDENWGTAVDSGTQTYKSAARPYTTTTLIMQQLFVSGSTVVLNSYSQASPFTWTSGDEIEFTIKNVPIVGFRSRTANDVGQQGHSWSGTHGQDCAWTTTSTSLAAIGTGDASCTFTQLSNRGFGTVASATASSNNIPGIVFTPVVSGKYFVCVTAHAYNVTAVGNFAGLAIHDGTSIITSASRRNGNASTGTNDEIPFSMCGIATLSAGASRTIQLYANASSGTTTLATGSSGVANVTWTIFNVDQPVQSILQNSVSTRTENGGVVSWAKVAPSCNSNPCTIQDASSDVVSVSRSSTGIYAVNFVAGFWRVAPTCIYTCGNASNLFHADGAAGAATTSLFPVQCYTSAGALSDAGLRVQCFGTR